MTTIEKRANELCVAEGYSEGSVPVRIAIQLAKEQKAIDDEEKKELVEAILDDISDNVCFDKFGRPFDMAEFRDKWIHKLEE